MPVTAHTVSTLTRLNPRRHLWAYRHACIPHRFPHLECDACRQACPVSALSLDEQGHRVSDACVGCGQCVAACPSGALSLPGLEIGEPGSAAGETIHVDCWRVAPQTSPPGAVRVPCLGALRTSQWLALARHAAPQGVMALDRGACGTCAAGCGATHPASEAIAEANHWLASIDHGAVKPISFVRRENSPGMLDTIPDSDTQRSVGRRGFLKALAGHVEIAIHGQSDEPARVGVDPVADGHARIHPRERIAVLSELAAIASTHDGRLPGELFTQLHISDDCRHHRLCASLCPTAALSIHNAGGTVGIDLDATLCISCGACEAACPGQAIRIETHQAPVTLPLHKQALTRHAARECVECGVDFADFAAHDDDAALPVCPACDRSHDFARAGFDTLFRPDRPAGRTPAPLQPKHPGRPSPRPEHHHQGDTRP